jgi:FHA domain
VKRYVVTESGHPPLPPLDLDGDVVIGSAPSARLRLPAQIARDAHVRIAGDEWVAIAGVTVDGAARVAGDGAAIGEGILIELGDYRVHVAPAPANAPASPPQRTESLARELVRGLLGNGAAPVLELVRGPGQPARRELPPPEAKVIIGRGDEATWVLLDEDLSREHAEIHRGWDGVVIRDLGSKNGTRVDGKRIIGAVPLVDGARIELANCELTFSDPAEVHLRGERAPETAKRGLHVDRAEFGRAAPIAFLFAVLLAALALAGVVWVLGS